MSPTLTASPATGGGEVHYLPAAIALSEGEWPRPLYPDWMSNLGLA
jgi:hypothetical protein